MAIKKLLRVLAKFLKKIWYHRHNFDPLKKLLYEKLVNSLCSKAYHAPRIIDNVICWLCQNGINQKVDICQHIIYHFVCKNVIHGFSNTYTVYSGYIY